MDRRSLLKRQLLKEQIAKEASAPEMSTDDLGIPTTSEEQQQLETAKPITPSDVKNFAVGASQGATLGFEDEMEGGVRAAGAKLMGEPESLKDLYAKYRDLARQRYESAQKESPMATDAGELTGTIASAALAPELGTGKIAAGLAEKVGASGVSKFLAGQTGGLAGKITGKAAAMTAENAPVGAAIGAGTSNAELGSREFGQDVKSGAELASGVGLALGAGKAANEGLVAAKDYLTKESPLVRRTKLAYDVGKEGKNIGSESGSEAFAQEVGQDAPQDVIKRIRDADQHFGEQVGKAITDADESGLTINPSQSMQEAQARLMNTLKTNPSVTLPEEISNKINQDVWKPGEMKNLKDQMDDFIGGFGQNATRNERMIQQQAMDYSKSLNEQLKHAIPEYNQAAQKFSQFREMVPETLLQYGNPEKDVSYGALKDKEGKLFENVQSMLMRSKQGGSSSIADINVRRNLESNLRKLETENPDAIKKMGYNTAEDAIQDLNKKADAGALYKEATGVEPRSSIPKSASSAIGGIAETGRGMITGIANKVGLAVGSDAGQMLTTPLSATNKIFKATGDKMLNVANRLEQSSEPLAKVTGNRLRTALEKKNDVARNALLFTILQNPNLRGYVKDEDVQDVQANPEDNISR